MPRGSAITVRMTRICIAIAVVGLVLVASAGAAKPKAPVSSFVDPTFGKVLSRTDKQVLYYWQVEKKAGGKVRCVGSCAKAWPPLIVRSAAAVTQEDRRPERHIRHDPQAERQAPGDAEQAARLHVRARAAAPGALRQRRRLVRRPPLGTTPRGPSRPPRALGEGGAYYASGGASGTNELSMGPPNLCPKPGPRFSSRGSPLTRASIFASSRSSSSSR